MPSGGGGSSAPSTTQVVSKDVPDWLKDPILSTIDRAQSEVSAPYQAYTGQRYAGFTPEQNQSFDMVQQGVGQYQPAVNAGIGATSQAGTPFDQNIFNQFMNPYQSQVVDEIGRLGNQNFINNIMPQVNGQFTGNGMFGSSRNAQVLGQAAENTQRDITGQQSQALASGFQNQMGNYNNAMGRELSAGAQLGNLATTGQNMMGNDINAVANVGQQKQQQSQNLADIAYNQFLEQQNYPKAQTSYLSDIIHGVTPQGVVNQTEQSYGNTGNPIAQTLGIGGTLYNAVNRAKGGSVKAKKRAPKKPVGIGDFAYG